MNYSTFNPHGILLENEKEKIISNLNHICNADYSSDCEPLMESTKVRNNTFNNYTESIENKSSQHLSEKPFIKDSNLFLLRHHDKFVRKNSLHSIPDENTTEDIQQLQTESSSCRNEIQDLFEYHTISDGMLQRTSSSEEIFLATSSEVKLNRFPEVRRGGMQTSSMSSSEQSLLPSDAEPYVRTLNRKMKFTTEKKWIVFCLCLADFTAYLSMSIIAPFFPLEAASKGMRESTSGFVFSIYALVIMFSSPVFGKLIPLVGTKFMFLWGVIFCGGSNILFGILNEVEGETEFAVLCFVVRTFEALGAAAYCTASGTILCAEFSNDIATVFGFTATAVGAGMCLGPAVGGALYVAGGFGLPFFVLGGCVLLIVPLCWYILKNIDDSKTTPSTPVSYKRLLSMPHVPIVCLILAVASQAEGFIDPTLEPHMRQYNLNANMVGLLFLLLSGAYTISSPVIGHLSGRIENKYPIMISGLLALSVSLLLIGPAEFLPIEGSVWLSVIALILMGVSIAVVSVPTFESLFIAALNGGLEDDISTYSVISGLWNSVYSSGEVIGPSLGGILSDFYEFPCAATYMSFCTLAVFIVALIAWYNPYQCFAPYSLIEGVERKSASHMNFKETEDAQCEKFPLQGKNTNIYDSFLLEKKYSCICVEKYKYVKSI